MPNTQQNNVQNETEQTNKEINLLQDMLKKKEKMGYCKSEEYE